jgi:REP element-mobilizing transposase RayT
VPILAYFLTWTTYGTWLPGDARQWVHKKGWAGRSYQKPDLGRRASAERLMTDERVRLNGDERQAVADSLRATCLAKGWAVHALAVRTNHVHIVVAAPNEKPEKAMVCLKAWASRALNVRLGARRWWTRHGSTRYLKTEVSLAKAIEYVNGQDPAR